MARTGSSTERRGRLHGKVAIVTGCRLCAPSDVANAAVYLASDEAAFITGIALAVDGGRCI